MSDYLTMIEERVITALNELENAQAMIDEGNLYLAESRIGEAKDIIAGIIEDVQNQRELEKENEGNQ